MSEPATHTDIGNLRRLQPLRVLLSGQDRRFVRVTSFLLTQRGYHVSEAGLGEMIRVAERDNPDVVLIEGGGSRSALGGRVAQLVALTASPAVVVVTDAREELWPRLRSIRKWAPVEELVLEIERAAVDRHVPDSAAVNARDYH